MKIHVRTLLTALVAGGALATAVYSLGLVNIGASGGHTWATTLFLHTAMRNSVWFQSLSIEAPEDLARADRIRLGAGHYESGCAPCHGSPAREPGAVALSMVPHPPDLASRIHRWAPEELFWIVRNGVMMTGMPAWPAHARKDEVWAVTAFLGEYPSLSAEEYRALAYGEAERGRALSIPSHPVAADCVRCHGEDGLGSPTGAFPRLDLQPQAVLLDALAAYEDGRRASGVMRTAAMGLTTPELEALAAFYARAETAPFAPLDAGDIPPETLARGRLVALEGLPEDDVAACAGCHAPEARAGRAEFPRLAGQYPGYLEAQLDLFADEDARRGGGRFAHLMQAASHHLKPEDREAVAAFYASRLPAPRGTVD